MEDIHVEIVQTCLETVREVRDFYQKAAKAITDEKLKELWSSICQEKETHVLYLHKLLILAKQGFTRAALALA